jgi:hypothetical protein
MADRHASWRSGQHEHPASGQQPLPVPDASGLGGTGLVADDLYLLAHGDRTGRPLLARRAPESTRRRDQHSPPTHVSGTPKPASQSYRDILERYAV